MRPAMAHRVYFIAVGVFALWVGLWGYLVPSEIDRAIPWPVPLLHARFLGAMYLSGTVLMFGSRSAGSVVEVRIALLMAVVWTGMLLLVSLLHLAEFDFARPPVWFWFFAYLIFPLMGTWLFWRDRHRVEAVKFRVLPTWAKLFALALAAVSCVLAISLFFLPVPMTKLWPWKIPPLLAQLYSGPFLSFGIGALSIAYCGNWQQARMPIWSTATFAVLVLLASILHRSVFTPGSTSALLWFGGFAIVLLGLLLTAAKMRSNGHQPQRGY